MPLRCPRQAHVESHKLFAIRERASCLPKSFFEGSRFDGNRAPPDVESRETFRNSREASRTPSFLVARRALPRLTNSSQFASSKASHPAVPAPSSRDVLMVSRLSCLAALAVSIPESVAKSKTSRGLESRRSASDADIERQSPARRSAARSVADSNLGAQPRARTIRRGLGRGPSVSVAIAKIGRGRSASAFDYPARTQKTAAVSNLGAQPRTRSRKSDAVADTAAKIDRGLARGILNQSRLRTRALTIHPHDLFRVNFQSIARMRSTSRKHSPSCSSFT